MGEKQFNLIGKSRQMRSVHFLDEDGKFRQYQIRLGITLGPIPESRMTFHVQRQEAKGVLQIVEIPQVEEKPPAKKTISKRTTTKKPTKRTRKKKSE